VQTEVEHSPVYILDAGRSLDIASRPPEGEALAAVGMQE
jgi:hypothetical protein